MSRWDDINAAMQERGGEAVSPPPTEAGSEWDRINEGLGNDPAPSSTPVADDLSIFERWGNSVERRGSSLADTVGNYTGQAAEHRALMGEEWSPEKQAMNEPTLGDGLWQVGGDALGLVWDGMADAVVEAGTEGFSLLPNSMQSSANEAFNALMQTEYGQAGINAVVAGGAAWDSFAETYPQHARTISKGLDLLPGAKQLTRKAGSKVFKKVAIPPTQQPLRWEAVGKRKILSPAKGRDKDVFNIIAPMETPASKAAKIKQGLVTGPEGIAGSQRVIPDEYQWRVVDEVKKSGVNPKKTMTTNANILVESIDDLNQKAIKITRGKGAADLDAIDANINSKIEAMRAEQPLVFGKAGHKGAAIQEDMLAQWEHFLDANGNSYEGLLMSRMQFDNYVLNNVMIGTFGKGKKNTIATNIHKSIRNTVNQMVEDGVPGTKSNLKSQSLRLDALDNVAAKGALEAETSLGRGLQNTGIHGVSTPLSGVQTATSPKILAAGLGALAVSPFVFMYNKTLAPFIYGNQARQLQGTIGYTLRDLHREMAKVGKRMKNPEELAQHNADMRVIAVLIHTQAKEEKKAEAAAKKAGAE